MAGVIAGDDPGHRLPRRGARRPPVSVKVAGADGITSLVRVLMALDWVRRNRNEGGLKIRVLNLSLGVDAQRSYVAEPLAYAAEALWHRGVAVVAAAGNQADGTGRLDLPASDPWLIAVGASVTGGNHVADFSSRDAVRPPDVVAPGTSVISMRVPGSTLDEEFAVARIGDDFFRGSGTSQAAAVVSGLAALLLAGAPGAHAEPAQGAAARRRGQPCPTTSPPTARAASNLANSLALATPSTEAAAQPLQRAVLDLRILWQRPHLGVAGRGHDCWDRARTDGPGAAGPGAGGRVGAGQAGAGRGTTGERPMERQQG